MAVINGTSGSNLLTGTSGADTINGLGGNDVINAGSGNDLVNAGSGNDLVYGGAGNDIIYGGDGLDFLWGGDGDDQLFGEAGADFLSGGAGNDTLNGGSGSDLVFGDGGNDTIIFNVTENQCAIDGADGGSGTDRLIVQVTQAQFNAIQASGAIAAFNASNKSYLFSFGCFNLPFDFNLVVTRIETLQFQIIGGNAAPVVVNDTKALTENSTTGLTGNVLTNDSDTDGPSALVVSNPRTENILFGATVIGTVQLLANGNYTVALNAAAQTMNVGNVATLLMSYGAFDGLATTNGTLTITVNGSNDAATISGPVVGTVVEAGGVANGTLGTPTATGTLTSTDVDNPANSFTAVAAGAATVNGYGTYAMTAGGAWTYTLNNANAAVQALNVGGTLTDTFTVTSIDGTPKVITVTIQGTNDAAVITGTATGAVTEDATSPNLMVSGILTATDVDNPAGFIAGTIAGAYGSLTINAVGAWTYTALNSQTAIQNLNTGQTLTDTLTVQSVDGTAKNIVITINGVNEPVVNVAPVANNDTLAAVEDTPITYTAAQLLGNDVDLDGPSALTIASVTAISGGSVVLNGNGTVTFTPNANFNGPASFSYIATDGLLNSNSAIVTVNVDAVNDGPVAVADIAANIAEDSGAYTILGSAILANDTDVDAGDTKTLTSVSVATPGAGTASIVAGDVVFNPALNYNGPVVLNYTMQDGAGATSSSTISFNVTPVNDAPTVANAIADQAGTEDTAFSYTIPANTFADVDNATLAYSLGAGSPAWLSINATTGVISGTPPLNFNGIVSVTVVATDAGGLSASDVFDINVAPVNDAPTMANAIADQPGTEDTAFSYTIPANTFADVDNATLAYSLGAGSPSWLTINATTGEITGTPPLNFNGSVSVTVVATDAGGLTASDVFDINVAAVNDGPVTVADVVANIAEDSGAYTILGSAILANDTDVDAGDTKTLTSVSVATPGAGTVALVAGDVVFTPALNFNGPVVLNYTMQDAAGAQSSSTISFAVTAVNDVATFGGVSTGDVTEDVNLDASFRMHTTGTLTVSDVDSPAESFFQPGVFGGTSGGVASIDSVGNWAYFLYDFSTQVQSLGAGQSFIDTVTFQSIDGTAQNITITVHGANDAALIGGTAYGILYEDDSPVTLQTSGVLTIFEFDTGEGSFAAGTYNGIYGSLVLQADGNWTYSADNTQLAIQSIPLGGTLLDVVTIQSFDGTTQDITITINGRNDTAVIGGVFSGDLTEDVDVNPQHNLVATGTLTITDVDAGQAQFLPQTPVSGAYGVFTLNEFGVWTYTVDNTLAAIQNLDDGQFLQEVFFALSFDAQTSQNVVVTIHGANEVPVAAIIGGDVTGNTVEDSNIEGSDFITATGQLTIIDPNPGQEAFFVSTYAGVYGNLSVDADGTWVYTADNTNPNIQRLSEGEVLHLGPNPYSDLFLVLSADGTTQTIEITITGTNDLHAVAAVNVNANEDQHDQTFVFGAITDVDISDTYTISLLTQPTLGTVVNNNDGSFNFNPGTAFDYLAQGETATVSFDYLVTDQNGIEERATATLIVEGSNDAPAVMALPDVNTDDNQSPFDIDLSGYIQGFAADPDLSNILSITNIQIFNDTANGVTLNGSVLHINPQAYDFRQQGTGPVTLQIVFNVSDGIDTIINQLTILLEGANDAPQITTPISVVTAEDSAPVFGFDIVADSGVVDIDDTNFTAEPGTYVGNLGGTLVIAPNVSLFSYTYTVNNANPLINALQVGSPSLQETFTYTLHDAHGGSSTATFTATINGSNDVPTILPPFFENDSVIEDAAPVAVDGNVITDWSNVYFQDVDSPITGFTVTPGTVVGSYGTLILSANGDYDYQLNNANPAVNGLNDGQTLQDAFLFDMQDGNGGTLNFNTLKIDINGTNDGPVAVADVRMITEDDVGVTGNVLDNDSDVDSSIVGWTITAATSTAIIHEGIEIGTVVLTPEGAYAVSLNANAQTMDDLDSVTVNVPYTMKDGNGASVVSSLEVTVTGTNDAPVVQALTINTDNNGNALNDNTPDFEIPFARLLEGQSDVDDALSVVPGSVSIAGSPAGFILNANSISVDPQAYDSLGVLGAASIQVIYQLTDGTVVSNNTATIVIAGTNDAPTVTVEIPDQTMVEDTFFSMVLNPSTYFSDVDSGALTLRAIDMPSWMTFDTLTNTLSGLPNGGGVNSLSGSWVHYYGPVAITIEARDSNGATVTDSFILNITSDNDAPVANNESRALTEEEGRTTALTGNVLTNDSDDDNFDADPLLQQTLTVVLQAPTNIVNTLSGNIIGTVSIAADGTYSIALNSTADEMTQGQSVFVNVNYQVTDGSATDGGILVVQVNGVNDAPVVPVVPNIATTNDNVSNFTITPTTLLAGVTDPDGTFGVVNGSIQVSTDPNVVGSDPLGALTVVGTNIFVDGTKYDSLAVGESKTIKVDFDVSDAIADPVHNSINVVINGANDAPVIVTPLGDLTIKEDAAFSYDVTQNFNDVDTNDTITYSFDPLSFVPAGLSIAPNGLITGTPSTPGSYFVIVVATDNHGAATTSSFNITVANTNDTPIAVNDSIVFNEDGVKSPVPGPLTGNILANDTDIDGPSALSILGVGAFSIGWQNPRTGEVDLLGTGFMQANGDYTITLNPFAQTMDDGDVRVRTVFFDATDGASVYQSKLTITVNGINDAPTAALTTDIVKGDNDAIFTVSAADLLSGVTDAEKNPLHIANLQILGDTESAVTVDVNNNVTVNPQLYKIPNVITISYDVVDSHGASVHRTQGINIIGQNDAPTVDHVISDQEATVGTPFSFAIPANTFADQDPGDVLTITTLNGPASLPSWLTFDGTTLTGTPDSSFTQPIYIILEATDSQGASVQTYFLLSPTTVDAAQNTGSADYSSSSSAVYASANQALVFETESIASTASVDITASNAGGTYSLNVLTNNGHIGTEGGGTFNYTGGVVTVVGSALTSTSVNTIVTAGDNFFNGAGYGVGVTEFMTAVGDVYTNTGNVTNAGNDTFIGSYGNDTLIGDVQLNTGTVQFGGSNYLFGGLGNDSIWGFGTGTQAVTAGFNTFAYDLGINNGSDIVFDFNSTLSTLTGKTIDNLELTNVSGVNNTGVVSTYDLSQQVGFETSLLGKVAMIMDGGASGEVVFDNFDAAGFYTMDITVGNGAAETDVGVVLGGNAHYLTQQTLVGGYGSDVVVALTEDYTIFGDDELNPLQASDHSSTNATALNDVLMGSAGNNTIYGDFKNNFGAIANAGDDFINAGDGGDVIVGDVYDNRGAMTNGGDDTIIGGRGDDLIWGDNVTGGMTNRGADTFVYDLSMDSGRDLIFDFQVGNASTPSRDKILVQNFLNGSIDAINNGAYYSLVLKDGSSTQVGQIDLIGVPLTADTRLTLQIDFGLDGVDTTQTVVLGTNFGVAPLPVLPFITFVGNDNLTGTVAGAEVMFGFSGDDTLTGDATLNPLNTIITNTSSDVLIGGDGFDTLYGDIKNNGGDIETAASDRINGGTGDDVIYGDVDNNQGVLITAGSDSIDGGDGNDTIYGDVAQGSMAANGGDDFIDGGAGIDLVVYQGAASNFDVSLIGLNFFSLIDGTGHESSSFGDRLINVENISFAGTTYALVLGSDAAAVTIGTSVSEYLLGFEGVDTILGDGNVRVGNQAATNDVILAGGGDDLIMGDFFLGVLPSIGGNDEINGGDGSDIAFYRTAFPDAALTSISFVYVGDNDGAGFHNTGTFQVISTEEGTDTLTNVERISLNNGTSRDYSVHTGSGVVVGNSFGHDLLIASGVATLVGDDTPLTASATNSGHDILVGSALNDTLVGDRLALIGPLATAGSDILKGGDGDDMLIGDVNEALATIGGNDILDGGAGEDTAAYSQDVSAFGFSYNNANSFYVSSQREGVDSLINVEKLKFLNNTYTVRAGSPTSDLMVGIVSANEIILGFLGGAIGDRMWGDGSFNTAVRGTLSDDILIGTDDSDNLIGDIGTNYNTVAQAGNDRLIAGAGDDHLYGDIAAGLMAAVGGNDELDGGAGTDTAYYLGAASNFTFVYLGDDDGAGTHNSSTIQLISLTEGLDTLTNIERIDFGGVTYTIQYAVAGSANGTIDADFIINPNTVNINGFSRLIGDLGNDIIIGGNSRDVIFGDIASSVNSIPRAGDDIIFAGGGNDDIFGDVAQGALAVVGGNDEIDGGSGTDTAYYQQGNLSQFNFEIVGNDDGIGHHDATTFRMIDTTGREGTDTLTNIEVVNFNGVTGGVLTTFAGVLPLNVALGTNGYDFGVTGVTDGNDLVLGFNSGANGDVLFGDTGSGVLGADYLVGSSQGDVLFGDSDTILGITTGGNDSLDGRGGSDTAAYKGGEGNFQFQNFAGVLRVFDLTHREGIVDDLMNMERISFNTQIAFGSDPLGNIYDIATYTTSNSWRGTSLNELFVAADGVTPLTLYGDSGAPFNLVASNDFIQGASGADNIYGDVGTHSIGYQHGGNDVIIGGLGDDNIWGDVGTNDVRALIGGNDDIDGGAGVDTAKYASEANINSFTVNYIGNNDGLGRHNDTTFQFSDMSGRDGTDTLTSIEQITFGSTLYKVVVAASSITNGSVASNEIMVGTNGSETLVGDYAGGSPISTASADIIFAGGGNDILVGDNVDTAPSIGGNDQLFGGAGDDIAKYKGTYDSLTFSYIGDTDGATGPRNASTFQISSVQAGTDVLTDIETLSFGGDSYRIKGITAGNASGGEVVTFDPLESAYAFKNIVFGFAGNDVLMGDDTPPSLQGFASDDILFGGEGNDDLYGDSKDGIFWTVGGNNIIDGGNGTDTLHYINASSAQNVIFDYVAGSNFTKLKATDITGIEGVNTLVNVEKVQYGLVGGQTYSIIANGQSSITGTNATDQIIVGTDLNNTLQGDTDGSTAAFSNDILFGGKGDDKLIGDALDAATLSSIHTGGNDTLFGGDGIDTAVYQGGFDHFVIQYSGTRGTEKMYNVIDVTNHEGTDMLIGVERIQFGGLSQPSYDLNNLSVGTNLADTLTHAVGAGAGLSFSVAQLNASHALSLFNTNNLIYGFDGNDSIEGNHFVGSVDSGIITGSDLIDGGAGSDEISGDSLLIFQHTYLAPNGVTVLYGSSGKLLIAGSDHILGGDGNDNLYGDVKVNVGGTLYSAGHDTLEGGVGNDLLVGDVFSNDRATDTTTGQATFFSAGNDVLFGGESADILVGDTYSGFQEVTPGHDTFVYDFSINNGADTILDFDLGGDKLEFRNLTNVTGSAAIDTADLNALTTVTNNNGFVQLNLFSDVANTNSLGSVTLGVLGGISGISFLSGTSGDDITDYQTLGWVQVSIV